MLKFNNNGAGDGNRTHTTGLEGQGSTNELHPHVSVAFAFILYSLSL